MSQNEEPIFPFKVIHFNVHVLLLFFFIFLFFFILFLKATSNYYWLLFTSTFSLKRRSESCFWESYLGNAFSKQFCLECTKNQIFDEDVFHILFKRGSTTKGSRNLKNNGSTNMLMHFHDFRSAYDSWRSVMSLFSCIWNIDISDFHHHYEYMVIVTW